MPYPKWEKPTPESKYRDPSNPNDSRRVYLIDSNKFATRDEFYGHISTVFGAYMGCNLDAFKDCLCGYHESIKLPYIVVWVDSEKVKTTDPHLYDSLCNIFAHYGDGGGLSPDVFREGKQYDYPLIEFVLANDQDVKMML